MDSVVPKEFVMDIMATAIRVALEEFSTNPIDADLTIEGIGRFYLNHERCYMPQQFFNRDKVLVKREFISEKEKKFTRWILRFTTAKPLSDVLNGRRSMNDLVVAGSIPLYPEGILDENGKPKKRGRGRPKNAFKASRKWIVQPSPEYANALKEMKAYRKLMKLREKLPEEDNNVQREFKENKTGKGDESTGTSRKDNSM